MIKRTPAPRKACDPLQIPNQQERIYMDLDVQIQGVRTPNKRVRIKEKVHVYIM